MLPVELKTFGEEESCGGASSPPQRGELHDDEGDRGGSVPVEAKRTANKVTRRQQSPSRVLV